jgi:hypothetical protein
MKRIVRLSTNITEQNRVLENVAQSLKSNTLLKRTHGILSTLARAIVEMQHATDDNHGVINTHTTQDITPLRSLPKWSLMKENTPNGTNNKEIDHSYGKIIRPSKRTKSRKSLRKNLSQVKVEQLKNLRKTMKNGLEVMIMVKQNRLKRWHMHPRGTVVIPNDVNSQ